MANDDLVGFLLARIEEAQELAANLDGDTWTATTDVGDYYNYGQVEGSQGPVARCGVEGLDSGEIVAQHIARHDPARVLADCAAKRAVAEVLAKQAAACPPDDWPEDGEIMKAPLADNARHLLRLLVQPYSGHPHFHPSWANTNSEA